MKQRKISVVQDSSTIRINIDELPHCIIKKSEFCGFCSYKEDGMYYIEIWLKRKRELLIHETREIWEEILKLLDEAL